MPRKIIINENQFNNIITEESITKGDVTRIVNDIVKNDRELERRVKNIAADVVKNLFRTLWQKNGMYDKDIRQ